MIVIIDKIVNPYPCFWQKKNYILTICIYVCINDGTQCDINTCMCGEGAVFGRAHCTLSRRRNVALTWIQNHTTVELTSNGGERCNYYFLVMIDYSKNLHTCGDMCVRWKKYIVVCLYNETLHSFYHAQSCTLRKKKDLP
jgi:hypothetical protein